MNAFACKIASFFINNSKINAKEKAIFLFGLEIILSTIASIITVLVISIPFGQFWGTTLYLFVFILIRQFTGGYHADSYRSCYLTFLVIYLLTIPIPLLCDSKARILTILFSWISTIPVFLFAPVQNANRMLTAAETIRFRRISRITVCALSILLTAGAVFLNGSKGLFLWGSLALLTMAIFIVVAIIKNGGFKNEKHGNETDERMRGNGHGCSGNG